MSEAVEVQKRIEEITARFTSQMEKAAEAFMAQANQIDWTELITSVNYINHALYGIPERFTPSEFKKRWAGLEKERQIEFITILITPDEE